LPWQYSQARRFYTDRPEVLRNSASNSSQFPAINQSGPAANTAFGRRFSAFG
jgi:hypothetical protein